MTQPQTILCPRCHSPGRSTARFCQRCGHDMILNNAGPRYYLTRVIKAGGQGAVYEAAGDDGKVYAVKEMLDEFNDPKERAAGIARFEAEANLLEHLSHPRIPKVYDHFEDEGRHYLTMDFVRGEDLADIVEREGRIPEQRVLEWADQICDVLGYLHANGLIYRDMKPSNVMLEANGKIKLIDFGIAKVLKGSQRGTQIGTPGYAPPEQYQGIATIQSDVYALAATLHHLLTGRNPQDHPPFSFPAARDLVSSISRRTSDALARALQMRPEDRYPSLDAFATALGLPSAQPAPSAVARATPPAPATAPAASGSRQAAPAASGPRQAAPAAPAPATAPAASGSRQAAPAAPAPTQPAPAAPAPTQPAPAPKTAGVTCLRRLLPVLLVIVVVVAGMIGVAFVIGPLAGPAAPTITPQTLVQQEYQTEAEIIVPPGTDEAGLLASFEYTYGILARERFGPATQVEAGSVAYAGGVAPVALGSDANGTRYRATLVGVILVPQQ